MSKKKTKPIAVKKKIKRNKKSKLPAESFDIHKVNVIDRKVVEEIEEQCKDCKAYKKGALPFILLHLAEGRSMAGSCKEAGVDVATLWRWRQKYPIIDETIKICLHGRNMVVEDALYMQALKGNVGAIVFWLCNRNKEEWKNVQNVEHTGTVGIEVTAIRQKMIEEQKSIESGEGK